MQWAVWMALGKLDPWTNVKTLGQEVEQDRMCIEPPSAKDVWGLIYTPCHIKHRKPLKPNKHFDTCRVVKGEGLITQIMHQPEYLEDKGETQNVLCPAMKKQTKNTYSPLAVRLSTESELCTDGLSPFVVMVVAASDDDSAILNDRYSCIMYRGYLLWFIERFLEAELALRPAWCLWPSVENTTPEEPSRTVQKTVRTLASIFLTESHSYWERGKDLLPSSSWSTDAMCRQSCSQAPL